MGWWSAKGNSGADRESIVGHSYLRAQLNRGSGAMGVKRTPTASGSAPTHAAAGQCLAIAVAVVVAMTTQHALLGVFG